MKEMINIDRIDVVLHNDTPKKDVLKRLARKAGYRSLNGLINERLRDWVNKNTKG